MARNPSGKKPVSGKNRPATLVVAGITALVILALFGFAVFSTVRSGQSNTGGFTPNDHGLIPVGHKAPEFTTKTVDGGKVSLGSGSPATMLVFFATWCPHCQKEAPVIQDFEDQYKNLRIIWVSVADKNWPETDTPQDVRNFMDNYGIQSPAAYDPPLSRTYKVTGTPTVYVINTNDKIVGATAGEAPREVYEQWIEKAL